MSDVKLTILLARRRWCELSSSVASTLAQLALMQAALAQQKAMEKLIT